MNDTGWSSYEQEVFDCFRTYFPEADIRKNVRLKGRYSKRMRQIDILITETTPVGPSRIVIDAKLHNRKLNVKAVEEFEGFVNDIGANKGLLISTKGYTRSALRRAFYCPSDLELDILDFSELKQWQAFGALPYVGDRAFLVPAPFGWVVDTTRTKGRLCTMFQRGLDIETAGKNKEFLYINYWDRKKDPLTAAELDKLQVDRMKTSGLSVDVSHRTTVRRKDAKTRLRYITVKQYKCLEVTGFLEFRDTIFFAVLLTPIEKQKQNVRRLEHILASAIPFRLKKDNALLIAALKTKLRKSKSNEERASILLDIGHWYRDMKQLVKAKRYLEQSISLRPNYYSIKELIYVLLGLGDRSRIEELFNSLLLLDLTNPTVFNDAIEFAHHGHLEKELIILLQSLATDQTEESLAKANCLYYSGQLLLSVDAKSARKNLYASREIFRKLLPPDHHVFKVLRLSLKQCRPSSNRNYVSVLPMTRAPTSTSSGTA